MRLRGIIFIILGFKLVGFSQKKIYVTVQQNKKTYPQKIFFTDRIIDNRTNKENIGYIYKTSRVNEHPADFKKGLSKEVLTFLGKTFPNRRAKNRILLLVNDLEIGHILSPTKQDSGFVKIDVDFYKIKGDSLVFLYNYKKQLTDVSESVELSHANRLKRIILNAFAPMDTALMGKSKLIIASSTVSGLLKNASSSYNYSRLNEEDSTGQANNYPPYYLFLIGVHANICASHFTSGIHANLLFQLKKHPRYLIGASGSFFLYGLFKKSNLPQNTMHYNLLVYNAGIKFLKQIKGKLFININPQLMIGKEQVTTNVLISHPVLPISQPQKIVDKLTGFELDIGVYRIPIHTAGIFYGADVFILQSSSLIFESNVGIKVNFGMKF